MINLSNIMPTEGVFGVVLKRKGDHMLIETLQYVNGKLCWLDTREGDFMEFEDGLNDYTEVGLEVVSYITEIKLN